MAKKKTTSKKDIGTGLIISAAAAAAIAGGYFLYGPQGKQNRKKIKGWTLKAKGEVLQEIEKMKEVSQDGYHKVVDKVLKKYGKMAGVTSGEVMQLGKELRSHWKNIQESAPKKSAKKSTSSKAKKKATARRKTTKK